MSKARRNRTKSASFPTAAEPSTGRRSVDDEKKKPGSGQATRETVESIVVAIILAFLFRCFLAEAFVIPTGSMAPTLQGRHKDVECEKCTHWYRVGASSEDRDDRVIEEDGLRRQNRKEYVISTTCPICRYTMTLDIDEAKHWSFSGDRILVNKFSYDLGSPQRWDIIVFKFPGNAVLNYIKRLVGLPNETLKIFRGDVYVRKDDVEDDDFHIARKPDHKLLTMLQLVDDTKHVPAQLAAADWHRWRPWATGNAKSSTWKPAGQGYVCDGESEGDQMLRYHHVFPTPEDWVNVEAGRSLTPPPSERRGRLIADFYAYNAGGVISEPPGNLSAEQRQSLDAIKKLEPRLGDHWVGDLALEASIDVQGDQGELILDLVEGGSHFQCRVDVTSGQAVLNIIGDGVTFNSADQSVSISGQTPIRAKGRYEVRFCNVDDELRLWVNEDRITFDGSAQYTRDPDSTLRPWWSQEDPGDLAPVGIGSERLAFSVDRLRVLRDIYYIASCVRPAARLDSIGDKKISAFGAPDSWHTLAAFDQFEPAIFTQKEDQFFPMGDNCPQSQDARSWTANGRDSAENNYVQRDLLIGKAVIIYWPHEWYEPVPFWPNFGRMGLIR